MLAPPLFFSAVRSMLIGENRERESAEALASAQRRVRGWTRVRFGLAEDSAVLVAELKCTIAGCPPLETALAFWTADGVRHQFKLLKAVTEVTERDLAWLIGDLAREEANYWDCC